MSKVNKIEGNRFEAALCDLLAEAGFWAHNMAQNRDGQPADVIAVKKDVAILIDCKVCSHDRFSLSRIEENQETAMTLWEATGNTQCYFAKQRFCPVDSAYCMFYVIIPPAVQN